MKIHTSVLLLGLSLSLPMAQASTLVEETFTRADAAVVRGTAASPLAGPVNWAGSAGFTVLSNGLQSATTGSGHVLGVNFGTNYFVDNPGLYTLTSDVFFESNATSLTSTKSWQIGFNDNNNTSAGANRSLLSNNNYGGAPGLILRADGMAQVKTISTSNPTFQTAIGTYSPGSVYNLKLVLDTQPTFWTVDAFINNVALDINGVDPGTTYTYAANPTLRYVTIASNLTATDNTDFANNLDNFKLTVIPEPGTLALTGLAALAVVLLLRRR